MVAHWTKADLLEKFGADVPQYTSADLCRLAGWSRQTLSRYLDHLPHCRVGRSVRFTEEQLRQILASFKVEAA